MHIFRYRCLFIFSHYYIFLTPPAGNEIFDDNLSSIVEVKCITENVGESYGSAEITTKEGQLITNAHVVTYTKAGIRNEFEKYFNRTHSKKIIERSSY